MLVHIEIPAKDGKGACSDVGANPRLEEPAQAVPEAVQPSTGTHAGLREGAHRIRSSPAILFFGCAVLSLDVGGGSGKVSHI